MKQRMLGDLRVGAIGLGAMPLSIESRRGHDVSIRAIHAALDAGVTLIDTADCYTLEEDGPGHNELLIAEALAARPADASAVLVATKGGLVHRDDGRWLELATPGHLRFAARASARRLGVEAIGLYQLHKPDARVPFDDQLGALAGLVDEGTVLRIGLSNVDAAQIRRGRELLGDRLVSVQNRFSPVYRGSLAELELCAELGLTFLPWSPLGGIGRGADLDAVAAFRRTADDLGVSVQRVALAWELALGDHVIPIPGASRPESITDSAGAADLELDATTVAALTDSLPVPA